MGATVGLDWAGAGVANPAEAASRAGDPGLRALALMASYHQVACEPAQIAHDLGLGSRPATAADLARAGRRLKLRTRLLVQQGPERLEKIPLPAILELRDGSFVLLGRRLEDGSYRIVDAANRLATHEKPADFNAGTARSYWSPVGPESRPRRAPSA